MDDEKIDVTDLVEELSAQQMLICLARAARKLGYPVEVHENQIVFEREEDQEALDEDENLIEAFDFELRAMVATQMMDALHADGVIRADGVDDEGSINWVLTEDGKTELGS